MNSILDSMRPLLKDQRPEKTKKGNRKTGGGEEKKAKTKARVLLCWECAPTNFSCFRDSKLQEEQRKSDVTKDIRKKLVLVYSAFLLFLRLLLLDCSGSEPLPARRVALQMICTAIKGIVCLGCQKVLPNPCAKTQMGMIIQVPQEMVMKLQRRHEWLNAFASEPDPK